MKRSTKIILGIVGAFVGLGIVASCSGTQASGGSQEFPAPPAATVSTVTSTVTTTATVTVTESSTPPAQPTQAAQLVPPVPAPAPDPDPDTTVQAPAPVTKSPAPPPAPTTTLAQQVEPAPAAESAYYANCSDARGAGAAPLYAGDPGYRGALDRDNDGVACE